MEDMPTSPAEEDWLGDARLARVLLDTHFVSETDLRACEERAKQRHLPLYDILLSEGVLTRELVGQAVAESLGVPFVDLAARPPSAKDVLAVSESLARLFGAVVARRAKGEVIVATDRPDRADAMASLRELFPGEKVRLAFAFPEDISAAFVAYRKPLETRFLRALETDRFALATTIVDQILEDALSFRASDVHIEPLPGEVAVRFRVDGTLREAGRFDKEYYEAILNRIKILARLRIDVHFAPQDGSIRATVAGQDVDLRVSVVPTIDGEKVALRLLSQYVQALLLPNLGFSEEDRAVISRAAEKPFGMILVSGPTGSGKSTTLYALLKHLQRPEVNIMTIEDPVEYRIPGVNQIQVNPAANLAFSQGLRSIVRQDPNVILVGEIRDRETAEIAVNAALTGHLLLSTFHANDAATSIPRLIEMGIEPFLLASTLELIVSQRLARRICQGCRHGIDLSRAELASRFPGIASRFPKGIQAYVGKGCDSCRHTGSRGRVALVECVRMTRELHDLILSRPSAQQIGELSASQGGRSMFDDGIEKVRNGVIALEELLRVTVPSESVTQKTYVAPKKKITRRA